MSIKQTSVQDIHSLPQNTIADIDATIVNYFTNLGIYVEENNKRIDVPVLMSGPERWKQHNDYRFLLDDKKRVILPLIFIKRDSIDYSEAGVLGNSRTDLDMVIATGESTLSKMKPNDEYYVIKSIPPRTMIISYTVGIYTSYVRTYNTIVEHVLYNGKKFTASNDKTGFSVYGTLGSFSDSFSVEQFMEQDIRLISGTASLAVTANVMTNHTTVVKKVFKPNRLIITENSTTL